MSPQIPDAPIEHRIVGADSRIGGTRKSMADLNLLMMSLFRTMHKALAIIYAASKRKDNNKDVMLEESTMETNKSRHQLLEEITKSFSERIIGAGGFGVVYRGCLSSNGEDVAVKRLPKYNLDVNQFQNEVSNLMKIGHPNIVQLIGHCSETEKTSGVYDRAPIEVKQRPLCLEYLPNGSLQKYLSEESSVSDWHTRYRIIQGICEGPNYLHEQALYHLDLKPHNILLDHNMCPKIADFGLYRMIEEEIRSMQSPLGTHQYQPPEYIEKDEVSKKFMKLNSSLDVEFQVVASEKGGTEIKIGSHVIHIPKYSSVRHPLVQMVLFACIKFEDTFACLKSMAPKSIFGMAKRLCSSAWTNAREVGWISARPKSEQSKKGTVSGFYTGNSIGNRKEPTENQSHHSYPDSSRAENGIKGVERKTPAAWVVATGAPHHATGDRCLLSGFTTEHNDQFVHAVDGVPMEVLARGAVVTDAVSLPDVWFVPGLAVNLISVRQLAKLDYTIGFGCGECCISADGKVVGKAHLKEDGLYVLDFLKVPLSI